MKDPRRTEEDVVRRVKHTGRINLYFTAAQESPAHLSTRCRGLSCAVGPDAQDSLTAVKHRVTSILLVSMVTDEGTDKLNSSGIINGNIKQEHIDTYMKETA